MWRTRLRGWRAPAPTAPPPPRQVSLGGVASGPVVVAPPGLRAGRGWWGLMSACWGLCGLVGVAEGCLGLMGTSQGWC